MIDAYFGSEILSDAALDLQQATDACVVVANPGKFATLDLQQQADTCSSAAVYPGSATLDIQQWPDSCVISGGVSITVTAPIVQAADSCDITAVIIIVEPVTPQTDFVVAVPADDFTAISPPRPYVIAVEEQV